MAYDSSGWLYKSLESNNENLEAANDFLQIVSAYWQKVDYALTCYLISNIYFQSLKSISLLKEIEKQTQNQSIKSTAKSYQIWLEDRIAINSY
jgi:hypothetical protein